MLKRVNKSVIVLLILMIALSFINILNIKIDGEALKLSGLSVIIGVVAYFITRKTNESKTDGLDIKTTFKKFKNIKVIIFALMPLILNVICTLIAKAFLPEFIQHVNNRISFITSSAMIKTILLLAVMTLGEEIGWRAFFQKQTSKIISFIPSLIITSIPFALGHYNAGSLIVVFYDLLFVFLNSIFYGLVFKNTDNAWCSWISHFLADILALFF